MARNRQNLNIIYISDRMRETLRPIASCALTAVVAPMGYGKTTAVRWFLAEQAKAGAVVLQASIYSDNRSIFWKSVQKAFAAAGLTVLEGYDCPADASDAALLLEDLCAALGGKTPYYLFWTISTCWGRAGGAVFVSAGLPPARERPPYRGQPQPLSARGAGGAAGAAAPPHRGRRPPPEPGGSCWPTPTAAAWRSPPPRPRACCAPARGWFSAVYLNLHALAEGGACCSWGRTSTPCSPPPCWSPCPRRPGASSL